MNDFIVIGSGPAGVSAAMALLAKGRRVVMLDGGVRLEEDREALVREMRSLDPEGWTDTQLSAIKEGMESGLGGIPLKRLYGSDFPYQDVGKFVDLRYDGADMTMSLAQGGLSNVWGSVVLPFAQSDIDDWPIAIADLETYYRKVFSFVPLAAVEDDLSGVLPLFSDRHTPLNCSRQADAFARDLDRSRGRLSRKGITFGGSRLAVDADGRDGGPGCAYCGLCLYGCPYDLIYSTSQTLKLLQADPNFTYVPDVIVDRLEESPGKVVVMGRNRLTGESVEFTAGKVFLGCGVISTTKVLLDSLDAFDRPVTMKDSQYFLVPLLRLKGVGGVTQEHLHTLTQICMELHDERISHRGIHISVYSHSDLFESVVKSALGPIAKLAPSVVNALLGRILVCGGYLHSDDSMSIQMRLQRAVGDAAPVMTMTGVANPRMRKVVRGVLMKLISCAQEFRGFPAFPVVRIGMPGRGYHAGGTFPMSRQPGEFECDSLGRPAGMRRVHVADATCFPSIPATNITLTVMANAYREAELCEED